MVSVLVTLKTVTTSMKILDQAINSNRFRYTNSLSDDQIESAKRMRDFIAFVDLLGVAREHIGTIELTSKENRLQILSLRNSGFFPGLQELNDEDAHRLFFEDLSLIFVSGTGEIAWTHEHLKEYAAALFLNSDSLIPEDIFHLLSTDMYGIINDKFDYDFVITNLLSPSRPYFGSVMSNLTQNNDDPLHGHSGVDVGGIISPEQRGKYGYGNRNAAEIHLQHIRNRIAHNQSVHPIDYYVLADSYFQII